MLKYREYYLIALDFGADQFTALQFAIGLAKLDAKQVRHGR